MRWSCDRRQVDVGCRWVPIILAGVVKERVAELPGLDGGDDKQSAHGSVHVDRSGVGALRVVHTALGDAGSGGSSGGSS